MIIQLLLIRQKKLQKMADDNKQVENPARGENPDKISNLPWFEEILDAKNIFDGSLNGTFFIAQ